MPDPRKPLDLSSANEILNVKRPPLDLSGAQDILKKKDSTVPIEKSVSGTPTGSSAGVNPAFKSNIPSPIPDFDSMESGKKPIEKAKTPPVKDETSFFDYLKENLDTGLATVSKSVYDAPGFVYDAFASVTNPVFEAMGVEKEKLASSDKLAKDLGFINVPSEILQEKIKVSNEKINAYSAKNGGDALQAVQDGNYVGAAKLVAGTTMQSLPIMVAAMASGGQTTALAAIGVSTASTKNAELKEEHPEMGLGKRVSNAANAGIIEAVTGHLFTGASGAVMKKILADKGVEAGSKIISKSVKSAVEKAIEKNPLVGVVGEIVEESAVEFGNQVNDMASGIRTEFDFHAVVNAGLSATGMGGIQTVGVYGAKGYVKAKDYAKLKAVNKEVFKLRNEIENGNLSDENKVVLGLRADRLEAENKKLLGTEIEKVKALPAETKTELNALNAEFEDLKSKFDDIDDADDIPDNLKPALKEEIKLQASKNQKRKTEILSQNDGLETDNDFSKFDGVEPDFDLENGKISSLPLKEQDRLNKLAVEQITGGDKTVEYTKEQVSQTANEIYKNEQTPETPETQPQAEVPQQAEAEKVATPPVEDVVAPSVEKPILNKDIDVEDSSNRKGLIPISELEDFVGEDRIGNAAMPNSRETIDKLKIDIAKNGFKEPIVLVYDKFSNDGEASIIEGNHRIIAAKELGFTEIPVRIEKGTLRSDEKRKADGMFPLNRKKIGKINDTRGVKGSDLGLTVRQPNEKDYVNEATPPTNTPADGNIRTGTADVGENGIVEQESLAKESVPSSVDGGESKGDIEVSDLDHAKSQIDKGVLLWNGDSGAERINLGISWADIRKGESDIKRGKPETVPAKRLIEALKTAKEKGGYEYVQGRGGEVHKQFVSLSDIQRSANEYDLTDLEQKEVDADEAKLSQEYENHFEGLDLQTQNDIYENYENQRGNDGLGEKPATKGESENDVSNQEIPKKPTTKEKIAERIKLSDAKIDEKSEIVKAKLKAFTDMFPSADINPDDYKTNGFSADAIVDMVAKAAKSIAKGGIVTSEHIKEAIKAFNTHFDDDVNFEAVQERITPKAESEKKAEPKKPESKESTKDMEDFRDSWNKDPNPSGEINQYDSGNTIDREHGELRNNQDYEVQKDLARVQIGIKAIEHAKVLFGSEYVEKTLSFIEQANLSPEKKAVAYVLLENEMDARAKEFPKNVGVQKLQDLVRAKSQEFLANSARAMGAGRFRVERFRELAKNGFSEDEFTNAILTTKQINDKAKIQKLIQVSPDDVNNESKNQESDEDFVIEEPTVKRNKEAVKKDISNVLAQMRKDLLKVAKGNVAMSSIPYAAQLQAVAPHIIKLSKLLAELGGMTTRQIVNEVYNDIKEVFPGINKTDVSDILKEHSVKKAKPKTEIQAKQDSVKEIVKKALIEKGFGREITVTKNERDASGKLLKDADGRNVKTKEKRTVLDWKKLAGEAGTIANIRKNVEESLKGSKYSKTEISEMKKALEREYVRLTSDVIEKGLNELQNRNAERKPVNTKSAAKKLAELFNYGLFEKNKDSYEKIINSVLGFNGLDQNAFNEMKEIARGYAVLMDSGLSDTEIKSAVNSLSRRQSRLVATLAFSQADWKFKLAVALSEITNLSTRFKLVNLGNLAENVSSGMMARAANNMMDAIANGVGGKKTSNKAIRTQSKINARAKLRGITLETAESYGDTSSLLLNHSAVEDYFNNATTNKVYHAIISTYMAKPVLEGADSFNKILITEAKMVRAAIKVLEAKGMSNSEALDYVAKSITGESMKEALVKAKALIEKVNEDAGRKLLNDSESSIKSLASDIVKESLVSGGQLSETELKSIYSAAYKSAGKDIGHVSNNWVTDQISAKGAQVEKQVADAIKEKKWSVASGAVLNQIVWKNFISTFVGGGTNWFVKGLQKSANPLSLVSLRDDMMKLKMAGKLDVTTDEGIKNMEESLYRGMNLRSTSATMLMGAVITASIIGGLSASGADDEIAKWLKENQWANKFFDKMVPDAVVLMLAIKDKDFGRYIAKMINVKADFFDDQKNIGKILEKYAQGYAENDDVKTSKSSGDLGAMLGKRFELPGPLRAAKDIKQIYKGVAKGEYDKTNYYTSGFMNGFFQGGIVEGLGLRKDPTFEEKGKDKFGESQAKIKEFNDKPKDVQDKIRANDRVVSLRQKVAELENYKKAKLTNTPYLVKGAEQPADLSNFDVDAANEAISKLNARIEEFKTKAGDQYKEPKE